MRLDGVGGRKDAREPNREAKCWERLRMVKARNGDRR